MVPPTELNLYLLLQVPVVRPMLPLAVLYAPGVPKVRYLIAQIPVALWPSSSCLVWNGGPVTRLLEEPSLGAAMPQLRGCWRSVLSFPGLWPCIFCVFLSLWGAISPSCKHRRPAHQPLGQTCPGRSKSQSSVELRPQWRLLAPPLYSYGNEKLYAYVHSVGLEAPRQGSRTMNHTTNSGSLTKDCSRLWQFTKAP